MAVNTQHRKFDFFVRLLVVSGLTLAFHLPETQTIEPASVVSSIGRKTQLKDVTCAKQEVTKEVSVLSRKSRYFPHT